MAKARRRGAYKFTPGRAQALSKARVASANSRRRKAQQARATKHAAGETVKKFTPYARINRHSQSVGVAARHKIPGTNRRFVAGVNVRVEKISRTTVSDKFTPHTTVRHGKVKSSFAQHTLFDKAVPHVSRMTRGRRGGRSSAV